MAKKQRRLTRATSLAAFRQLVESGEQLSKQEETFATLLNMKRATANEIGAHINAARGNLDNRTHFDQNIHARINELRRMGLVRTVCTRACTVTGAEVLEWEVIPEAERTGEQVGNISTIVDRLLERISGLEFTPEEGECLVRLIRSNVRQVPVQLQEAA